MDWREAYPAARARRRLFWPGVALAAAAAFLLPFGVRCLEIPTWDNPAYKLDAEYLLATQDAYHWIAGAEGFEFGAGHPMSELIRHLSLWTGMPPANVGFWLPLFLGSLLSVGVFAWGAALGFPCAGLIAGALASLSPGFLARTLLGYCDTDLVILFFGLLLGFVPMLWLRPWLSSPAAWIAAVYEALSRARDTIPEAKAIRSGGGMRAVLCRLRERAAVVPSARRLVAVRSLSPAWLTALILAGLWGHSTQEWHSFFSYAVRFSAVVLPLLILLSGPKGGRRLLLTAALCHDLPLLAGCAGVFPALFLALALLVFARPATAGSRSAWVRALRAKAAPFAARGRAVLASSWTLAILWLAVAAWLVNVTVWEALVRSIGSYIKTTGEVAGNTARAADPLVYPAVAQSISEVQNLHFEDFLSYFHPSGFVTLTGLAGYACLLLFFPATAYLILMLAVALSSMELGGRMAMFGSPVLALGFSVGLAHVLAGFFSPGWEDIRPLAALKSALHFENPFAPVRWLLSVILAFVLVWPMAGLIPTISKGPIISPDQARALSYLRSNSPEDSMVWNWWDWGYAAHHFARRRTISDGARHGGPSLYIPAAVYTTTDPHFARQLMAYTSEKGGDPGEVLEGLSAGDAAKRIADLESGRIAPVPKNKQYLVVSAELVPLGFWISTYGTWDFTRKEGKGYFITSIPQSLQYSLDTGVVLIKGQEPAYAASIDVFSATELKRQTYYRTTDARFVFNTITGDKFLMKNDLYNTLLYQLLAAKPGDARFAPYFKLVYDSAQVRVYEMQ